MLVRVAALKALVGGGVGGEGVAEFGDASQGGFSGVVDSPALVLSLEPAFRLGGERGFVAEPVEAAVDAVEPGAALADLLVGLIEALVEVVGMGEPAVAVQLGVVVAT